ncbi:putative ribonuclease H-like domain-containing protein [Tanacetum coccineum]
MAISSSSSSSSSDSEVQKCSKCLELFKCIQKNYDTEREKHNKAKLEIRGYEIALESLEARILGHEKNELAWGERYEFQNYDLKCREIKINNLNLELEKVVKERDELKLKIEKWEGSSKNLTKIINSQMSTHDKNGLGFGTQMDDLSNKFETNSENSLTIFEVRSSDEESTLENNRFTKANEYHVVPPPITGNPLTPRADISFAGLDEYAFRNKIIESKTTKTNKTVGTTNLAFLSSENTNSTNEVSTASGDFGVSTAGGINQVPSTPSAHDIAYSFLAQPTTSPQLENEDFQQIDGDNLEELDLRWQVAMLTVRIECYNCHRKGHFARECRSGRSQGRRPNGDNGRSSAQTTKSSSQALVAQDGLGGYDWSNDFEVEPVNYALMAISSSNSSRSSDSEVQKCSKCLESFKCLQKNYDTEREKHNKAKLEIRDYKIALESLEARILGHEKNELAWGERYEFQNYDLKCREIKINNLNLELEKVVKERDELKLKIKKWEGSSKNLTKILNS